VTVPSTPPTGGVVPPEQPMPASAAQASITTGTEYRVDPMALENMALTFRENSSGQKIERYPADRTISYV
jgi:hypothetical protein